MGKDLKGRELGKGVVQRKDKRYYARYTDFRGKRIEGYFDKVTDAKRFVAEAGFDPSFGARPLKRAIRKYIEDPVSECIISNRMFGGKGSGKLKVSLSKDKESTAVVWQ